MVLYRVFYGSLGFPNKVLLGVSQKEFFFSLFLRFFLVFQKGFLLGFFK